MKEIKLTQGKVAFVDDEDYGYLNKRKWYTRRDETRYYASANTYRDGKRITINMHRIIMQAKSGELIDHRDGNGLNNQRGNLRICTNAQNTKNAKVRKDNTSGYKGVCWHSKNHYWTVYISVDKKRLFLGGFSSKEEAGRVYAEAVKKYHGEFAYVAPQKNSQLINQTPPKR